MTPNQPVGSSDQDGGAGLDGEGGHGGAMDSKRGRWSKQKGVQYLNTLQVRKSLAIYAQEREFMFETRGNVVWDDGGDGGHLNNNRGAVREGRQMCTMCTANKTAAKELSNRGLTHKGMVSIIRIHVPCYGRMLQCHGMQYSFFRLDAWSLESFSL